jgi:hypothetical protein
MRGKAVTKRVRMNAFLDAGALAALWHACQTVFVSMGRSLRP